MSDSQSSNNFHNPLADDSDSDSDSDQRNNKNQNAGTIRSPSQKEHNVNLNYVNSIEEEKEPARRLIAEREQQKPAGLPSNSRVISVQDSESAQFYSQNFVFEKEDSVGVALGNAAKLAVLIQFESVEA